MIGWTAFTPLSTTFSQWNRVLSNVCSLIFFIFMFRGRSFLWGGSLLIFLCILVQFYQSCGYSLHWFLIFWEENSFWDNLSIRSKLVVNIVELTLFRCWPSPITVFSIRFGCQICYSLNWWFTSSIRVLQVFLSYFIACSYELYTLHLFFISRK